MTSKKVHDGRAIWEAKTEAERAAVREAQARRVARRAELNANREVVVYALTDPDGTPRYVGRTAEIARRFEYHRAGGSSQRVQAWFGELSAKRQSAGLMILAVCHALDGASIENYYLSVFGKKYPLLNTCRTAF